MKIEISGNYSHNKPHPGTYDASVKITSDDHTKHKEKVVLDLEDDDNDNISLVFESLIEAHDYLKKLTELLRECDVIFTRALLDNPKIT